MGALLVASWIVGGPVAASATTFTFQIGTGGLDEGQICTAGGAQCSPGGTRVTFNLDNPPLPEAFFPAVGAISLDTLTSRMDISMFVATSTFVASPGDNGINEIVFTNVSYVATNVPILISGVSISLNSTAPNTSRDGIVAGTYLQLNNALPVVPNTPFNSTARLTTQFSCLLTSGNTFITCGIRFGPGQTNLAVGNVPVGRAFAHLFNVTGMVPEPSTAALLGLGLLGLLGWARRVRS